MALSNNNNQNTQVVVGNVVSDSDVPHSNDIPLINFYPSEEREDSTHATHNQYQEIGKPQFSGLI